ncbi:MAG: signal peptidase I [Myxococcota bacterium]
MKREDSESPSEARGGAMGWCADVARNWGVPLLLLFVVRSAIAEPFHIPSGSMAPTLEVGDRIVVSKSSYGMRIPLTRIPIGDLSAPERGDVIVFVHPGSDTWQYDPASERTGRKLSYWLDMPLPGVSTLRTIDYVKRVVGLPGETIELRDGVLLINDIAQHVQQTHAPPFQDQRCETHDSTAWQEQLAGSSHTVLHATTRRDRSLRYGPVTVPAGHVFTMGDNRDRSSDSRVWGFVPLRNIKGRVERVGLSFDSCAPDATGLGVLRTERTGQKVE